MPKRVFVKQQKNPNLLLNFYRNYVPSDSFCCGTEYLSNEPYWLGRIFIGYAVINVRKSWYGENNLRDRLSLERRFNIRFIRKWFSLTAAKMKWNKLSRAQGGGSGGNGTARPGQRASGPGSCRHPSRAVLNLPTEAARGPKCSITLQLQLRKWDTHCWELANWFLLMRSVAKCLYSGWGPSGVTRHDRPNSSSHR